MRKIFIVLILFCMNISLFAGGGIFDSFAIVNANGAGNTYYDLGASTANPDFQGANLGSFDLTNHSLVLGGQLKSYKNNGTDVTGASLFYRIYPVGSPSGSFTEINYAFQIDNVNGHAGDQQWGTDIAGSNTTDKGVDILSGSTLSSGDYTLEVYAVIYTNGVDAASTIYDSRGGLNYQATFTVNQSLPVELTSFSANISNKYVELKWKTATEVNNYGFYVERKSSFAKGKWNELGFVKGHGNSNSPEEYKFVDKTAASGKYFYRLKQVDVNGSYEYSNIIEANLGLPSKFSLSQNYPNPFNPATTIKYTVPVAVKTLHATSQLVQLKIYDVLGKEVVTLVNKQQSPGNYSVTFNASNLPSGIYFYKLTAGNFSQIRKMILLK